MNAMMDDTDWEGKVDAEYTWCQSHLEHPELNIFNQKRKPMMTITWYGSMLKQKQLD